jgi:type IV secretion system T-DNA border endonuclease VirD2
MRGLGIFKMSELESTLLYEKSIDDMLLIAQGLTQSILKISGYGKGICKILAHLNYITRRGTLAIEDQDGLLLCSCEEQEELIKSWSFDFGANAHSRDTVHLVLSTPPGSSPQYTRDAAKSFLAEVFASTGHQYLFVMHTDTDHPHVHVVIKLMSDSGKKLNPRKAYLQEIRSQFAAKCRQYGIAVEASLRWERGLGGKSTQSTLYQMKKRGKIADVDVRLEERVYQELIASTESNFPWDKAMLERNQTIRNCYLKKALLLAEQAEQETNALLKNELISSSNSLKSFAEKLPIEVSRATLLCEQLEGKHK